MKLGCNWSPHLHGLLLNNQVEIDYIKTGMYGDYFSLYDNIRELKPILLHGLGHHDHTGMTNISEVLFDLANEQLEKCLSPHYGLHLSINNSDVHNGMTENEMFTRMCDNVQVFKQKLNVPIILENMPDSLFERDRFDLYPYVRNDLINNLIKSNDVALLLDISHARVAAEFNNWNLKDYITSLATNPIKEIHINGTGLDHYGFIGDIHTNMSKQDYELLEWVLTICNPDIITLEYTGSDGQSDDKITNQLIIQLQRLNEIIRS